MKKSVIAAAAALLLATNIVSYVSGTRTGEEKRQKDYQAACILSDACRNMVDNLGAEAEAIYSHHVDSLEDLMVTSEEIRNGYSLAY